LIGVTNSPPKAAKRWLELSRVAVLPLIYLLLVIAEHNGLIDRWRGLDRVQAVADNFRLSYAPDASKPVYPSDAAWKPLIDLIQRYSKVKLRTDMQPQTVARFVATVSAHQEETGAEWTSPSTPFAVIYKHWPDPGTTFPREDYTIVGSIGDLQNWISQSKADCHFLIHDIVLGILALVLGYTIWHATHLYRPTSMNQNSVVENRGGTASSRK
jgi:hypothetical protein